MVASPLTGCPVARYILLKLVMTPLTLPVACVADWVGHLVTVQQLKLRLKLRTANRDLICLLVRRPNRYLNSIACMWPAVVTLGVFELDELGVLDVLDELVMLVVRSLRKLDTAISAVLSTGVVP